MPAPTYLRNGGEQSRLSKKFRPKKRSVGGIVKGMNSRVKQRFSKATGYRTFEAIALYRELPSCPFRNSPTDSVEEARLSFTRTIVAHQLLNRRSEDRPTAHPESEAPEVRFEPRAEC